MTNHTGDHVLTFDQEGGTALTASCRIGQFTTVRSCVGSLQLLDLDRHGVVLLNEFVFYTTGDFGPVFLPLDADREGAGDFATYLNKGAQDLLHVYQRFDEAWRNDLLCSQERR